LFPQFLQEAVYEKSVHSWQKKNVVSSTVSSKNHTALPAVHFSECDISIHDSLVVCHLVEDLKFSQLLGFIIWSGLGHRVAWYNIMNVLEEHSEDVFTGSRKMGTLCPD
jgi:hypothetical protein